MVSQFKKFLIHFFQSINGIDDPANASVRHLTYSVPCIQMFVYLIAPLSHVIREEEIENHIRLESGLRLWQALWEVTIDY